jgi:DNA-binding CsgD family transcriptional regulator
MESHSPIERTEARVRSVVVRLPPRLQNQHSSRLALLTPEGWRLAEVAALMAQPFAFEALARVMGEPVGKLLPAVRDALAAGVIVPTKSNLMFRHDLVRQAIYQQVPGPLRLALLRRMENLAPVGEMTDEPRVRDGVLGERQTHRSAQPAEAPDGGAATSSIVSWAVPGDLTLARVHAENVLGCAHAQDADDAIAAALSTLGFIAWNEGRVADALGLQRASVLRAYRAGSAASCLQPHFGLATVCTAIGDVRQAHDSVLGIAAAVRMAGGANWLAAPPVLRSRLATAMGSIATAAAEATMALELEERYGTTMFSAAAFLVLAAEALKRGGLAEATSWLERLADQPSGTREVLGHASIRWVEARLAEARSGPAEAHGIMAPVYRCPTEHLRLMLEQPLSAAWLVRTALEQGDTDGAERVTTCAEQLGAANSGFPFSTGSAAHTRALLDQDAPSLARLGNELRSPLGRAAACEDAGKLLARSGQRALARAQYERAVVGFERMGARFDEARARGLLADLGPGRHRAGHGAPVSGWESLTDAERRVAELVALGFSNAQAASQLYLSRHTVDFHLRQIFRKLNVVSRVELVRLSLERQRKAAVATGTGNGTVNSPDLSPL